MNILECSSKGDKRFSAFYAKISIFGVFDSVENHYQLSKRFYGENGEVIIPKSFRDAKGKQADYFEVKGIQFPIEYLNSFYKLLWVKYLDANPSLVKYASTFDEFTDIFKGKSMNCQADVIKQYVKEGRSSIMKECKIFSTVLKNNGFYHETTGDLLESKEDIRGHQTNCLGVMGAGIADVIRKKYPEVLSNYKALCFKHNKSRELLGMCQVLQTNEGNYIANLFGQHSVSYTEKMTDDKALEKALILLKKEAKEKQLTIGLPWQLGSGHAGGNWLEIKAIIQKVFTDYPVTVYKLPGL